MNSGETARSAASQSPTDWLDLAVRRGYLSQQQSTELTAEADRSGLGAQQLAVERGLMSAQQRDMLDVLAAPEQVAPGYRVIDVIGCGGLGVVYLAQQLALDRPVALKTVLVTRLNTPGTLARFQLEAKTIGGLRHPNIVTAFDTGTHAGRLYLVMELVEGVDLAQVVQLEKQLDEFRALWIVRQVAGGLAHAAERGVVHRDIKPANVLVTQAPQGYPLPRGVPLAKITDFGLALLAAGGDDTRLTLAGTTMGTPHYMAPEQLAGSTVDLRADIYALGATLYHLLTGAAPFGGATLAEIVANRMKGVRRPIATGEGFSAVTVRLVERMMADDPAVRPADYEQLLALIDEAIGAARPAAALDETSLFAAAGAVRQAATQGAPTRTMASLETQTAPAGVAAGRPHWGKPVVLLAVLLAGAVAALWGGARFLRSGPAEDPPAAVVTGTEVPLFDGSTLAGWDPRVRGSWGQGRDAEGGFVLQGRATPAQAACIVRSLPVIGGRAPANFRVQIDVDLREAQRLAILFGPQRIGVDAADRQGAHALFLEPASARVGTFDSQSQFQPAGPTIKLSLPSNHDGPAYRNVKIDCAGGQWRVYVDDQLAGKLPSKTGSDPFWIGLLIEQGAANFANLQLVELGAAE